MTQCLIEQMCTSLTKVAKTTKNKLCHKQFILDCTLQGAHTHTQSTELECCFSGPTGEDELLSLC